MALKASAVVLNSPTAERNDFGAISTMFAVQPRAIDRDPSEAELYKWGKSMLSPSLPCSMADIGVTKAGRKATTCTTIRACDGIDKHVRSDTDIIGGKRYIAATWSLSTPSFVRIIGLLLLLRSSTRRDPG